MDNQKDFSILFVFESFKNWFNYIFSNVRKIAILTSSFLVIVLVYNYLKSPLYYARTSFVLDSESSSNSIGDIASLASLAGINASSFIDASSLFQIDNIQELYRSSSMLKQTLMSNSVFENEMELLINRFGKEENIDKKWNKLGVNFSEKSVVEYFQ